MFLLIYSPISLFYVAHDVMSEVQLVSTVSDDCSQLTSADENKTAQSDSEMSLMETSIRSDPSSFEGGFENRKKDPKPDKVTMGSKVSSGNAERKRRINEVTISAVK